MPQQDGVVSCCKPTHHLPSAAAGPCPSGSAQPALIAWPYPCWLAVTCSSPVAGASGGRRRRAAAGPTTAAAGSGALPQDRRSLLSCLLVPASAESRGSSQTAPVWRVQAAGECVDGPDTRNTEYLGRECASAGGWMPAEHTAVRAAAPRRPSPACGRPTLSLQTSQSGSIWPI